VCSECGQVAQLVLSRPGPLCLVVDGSFGQRRGGAGLVLTTGDPRGVPLAICACWFPCARSLDAELEAIERGAAWAPGVPIISDSEVAIATLGASHPQIAVRWIESWERGPNHRLAHMLSVQGRQGATRVTILGGDSPDDVI
jgi:hypothetical protein